MRLSRAGLKNIFYNQNTTIMKREEIAAMVLQSLIAKYTIKEQEDQRIIAKLSVQLADELLNQLKPEPCAN